MNTIKFEKINLKDFKKSYMVLAKIEKDNEKIEILFNEKGEFSGHLWEYNCAYSNSDLERNGDFKLDFEDSYHLESLIQDWIEIADRLNQYEMEIR